MNNNEEFASEAPQASLRDIVYMHFIVSLVYSLTWPLQAYHMIHMGLGEKTASLDETSE